MASWSLALIGLANIVGSLAVGHMVNRYRSKYILFWMYASRADLIVVYLAAPKTEAVLYALAVGLGLPRLATVPPTPGIVGARYLATLFGLLFLSHLIGGFFGAYVGGLAVYDTGNYLWMWYADAVFALAAALVNLPSKEPKCHPRPATG